MTSMARCPSASSSTGDDFDSSCWCRIYTVDKLVAFQMKMLTKFCQIFQRIIFLCRDGVGDGQINYVLEHEIKAIEKCFAGINQADLKFTYIIVSKRINTRFFR